MDRRPAKLSVVLLSLLSCLLFAASRSAAGDQGCLAAGCHPSLLAAKTVHAATESCDNCHEATAPGHPQPGQKTFRLTAAEPELCQNCHDPFARKVVHSPAADGSCSTCHSPHASNVAKLLLKPQGELCAECHSEPGEAKVPHGPVASGECTACHAPHESDLPKLLVRAGDALCADCHGDVTDLVKAKPVKHAALDDGCTTCHAAHGSAHPKLLAEEGQALCFQCHDDVGKQVTQAKVAHAAVDSDAGCANCHSPHAADQAKLLLRPEKETCLACHAEVLDPKMTVLHGPIADGSCVSCHRPHGGEEGKLLLAAFPSGGYAAYSDTTYALCFECHDSAAVRYPDTSFATGFRDGERNLHYLHVNDPQKGRSCALCHGLHGAPNPALIADRVPFGKWHLPIKFVKTETGGSCAPGCHQPVAYDRQTPVGPTFTQRSTAPN